MPDDWSSSKFLTVSPLRDTSMFFNIATAGCAVLSHACETMEQKLEH
jgi:hypothetical protein